MLPFPAMPRRLDVSDLSLLSYDDLSRLTGYSKGTLSRWRHQGRLPPEVLLGRLPRWRPEDVAEWIESHRRHPEP